MTFGRPLVAALAAILVAGLGCGRGPADPGPWPQWRGPGGGGVSPATGLPESWSDGAANVRWEAPLPGPGNSSPIVGGDRTLLTYSYPVDPAEPMGEYWRAVAAFDLATGERLWATPVFSGRVEKTHQLNHPASATPVTDGEGVWVYFGSVLARLDLEGAVVWQKVIDPTYAKYSRYGAASSPVLAGDAVIVVQDREYANKDVGWMAAFDKATGDELWRTEWVDTCCSYSTPLVAERGGATELVFAHSAFVAGYDAGTGEKLWQHPYSMLQMVSTPILEGDLLAVLGGADHDRGNVVVRLDGAGRETTFEVLWENLRLAPQASSPVLYNGLLFSVTEQGVLVCYEPESGDVVWRHRLPEGRVRATLVAADGKIYVTSFSGVVAVVAAEREYRLLAANRLGEGGTTASPAIGGGCLLLRSESSLYCVEKASE